MKLIKLMLAIIMALAMVVAQDTGDHEGGPPNNHWDGNCGAMNHGESEYFLDSDGNPDNGAEDGPYAVWHEDADGNPVDCGPGPDGGDHDGPPPFEDVDTNGDGVVDREEARAMFGHDKDGNPDSEFDAEYDRIDTNGDGEVDHGEYMASDGGDHDGGPGTCDVCGHEYAGEGDHHGHCRVCDAEMNTDDDWRAHCDENWEHCKPQAGDTCGFKLENSNEDPCDYVYTGDAEEDHHHCDTCGAGMDSSADMEAHCNDNPDHCHGGDHDGPPPFEDVDTNGDGVVDREEARAMFGHDKDGNPDSEFDAEYDRIDTNGDGVVDHGEYMASDGGDHNDGNEN